MESIAIQPCSCTRVAGRLNTFTGIKKARGKVQYVKDM